MDKMPEPQTNNYMKFYKVSDVFIQDYKEAVESIAYVDAVVVLDIVNRHDGIVNTATVNEIVRIIGSFPYKYVSGIMANFKNADILKKYFIELPNDYIPNFLN